MLALAVAACACQSTPRSASSGRRAVRIAAAADLRFALDALLSAFRAEHPDIAVSTSFGSSGMFFAQLVNGAPFDVFLSADAGYPRQLAERGLTLPASEFLYAVGRIVVWTTAGSAVDVERSGLRALASPAVHRVAIANPEHAPYGRAAEAALRAAGLYARVAPKLVLGENVAQALQFVQSGSAEAGIIALSLALSPPVQPTGRYGIVPLDSYPLIEQGGTILRWATDAEAARAFRDFLIGGGGRAILKQYGFFLPGE